MEVIVGISCGPISGHRETQLDNFIDMGHTEPSLKINDAMNKRWDPFSYFTSAGKTWLDRQEKSKDQHQGRQGSHGEIHQVASVSSRNLPDSIMNTSVGTKIYTVWDAFRKQSIFGDAGLQ